MAVYGIDFFGTAYYGAPLFLEFDARPFTATSVYYGTVRLSWIHPSGDWDQLRLVRSSFGFPEHPDDGVTLVSGTKSSARTGFTDQGLFEGKFYYYSIFVRDTETGSWVRAGDATSLTIEDHGYSDRLFSWMPGYFQEADRNRVSADQPEGPLQRYLSVVALALDHLRSEYDSLLWLRNPDKISGNLLPLLAEQFGLPLEPSLGMRQTRVWLRDAVYLYRHKGTLPGIEAAASAVTGWGARVEYSKNLFRGESAYAWYPFGALITDDASPDNYQIPALRVASSAAASTWTIGSAPLAHYADNGLTLQRWFGARVTAGSTYALRAEVRAEQASQAGATFRWRVVWFDADGAWLSQTNLTASSPSTSGGWVNVQGSAAAPANAVYAAIYLECQGGGGSPAAHFVRRLQIEQATTPTTWEAARSLRIRLDPVRENLVTNPSFGTDTAGWEAQADSSLTRVTDQKVYGSASALLSRAGGEAWAQTPFMNLPRPGARYVASFHLRGEGVSFLRLRWFGDGPEEISHHDVAVDSTAGWGRYGVSDIAPYGATRARAQVFTDGTDVHIDGVMFEEGDSAGPYFDGEVFGADWVWTGTPHASTSRFYPGRTLRNVRLRELLPEFLPLGQNFVITYQE